jgi:hypothetical protein
MSNQLTTLQQRARLRARRGVWFWWAWLAAFVALYVLRDHLELLSLDVSSVLVIVFLGLGVVGAIWLYLIRGNDCNVCEFIDVQSTWKFCPGCGIETRLSDAERQRVPRPKFVDSVGDLYRYEGRLTTTRRRAKRWRLANIVALLSFFVFVFGMFPLYFVGPWVNYLAPRWWWFMFSGMLPFIALQIATAVRGLRCVQCNAKLGVDAQTFVVASTKPGKHHWAFCPHCAHSLDAE